MTSRHKHYVQLGRTRPWEAPPPREWEIEHIGSLLSTPYRPSRKAMAFVFLATFIVNYACAFIPMAANSTYVQWVFEELKKPPWTVPGWFLLMMWVLTTGTNALASSLYVLYAMVNWRERWLAGMPFLLLLAIQCVWVDLFFYWHQWTLLMVLCVLAIVCGALSTVWWWLAINGLVGALMLPFTGWLCYMVALLSYFQSS